jgi:hypothetical protein
MTLAELAVGTRHSALPDPPGAPADTAAIERHPRDAAQAPPCMTPRAAAARAPPNEQFAFDLKVLLEGLSGTHRRSRGAGPGRVAEDLDGSLDREAADSRTEPGHREPGRRARRKSAQRQQRGVCLHSDSELAETVAASREHRIGLCLCIRPRSIRLTRIGADISNRWRGSAWPGDGITQQAPGSGRPLDVDSTWVEELTQAHWQLSTLVADRRRLDSRLTESRSWPSPREPAHTSQRKPDNRPQVPGRQCRGGLDEVNYRASRRCRAGSDRLRQLGVDE